MLIKLPFIRFTFKNTKRNLNKNTFRFTFKNTKKIILINTRRPFKGGGEAIY